MPAGPLEFGLSSPSSAASGTGDDFYEQGFNVDFGDKVTGDGSGGGSDGENLSKFATDLIKAVMVAVAAKYILKMVKK